MNNTKTNALDSQPSEDKNPDTSQQQKSEKKPFRWSSLFIFLSLMLAILGLAGAGYVWYEFDQYKKQSNLVLEQKISAVDTRLSHKVDNEALSSYLNPLVTPIQDKISALESADLAAEQTRTSLKESTQKLFELYGRDKNGWQLAEVEYLLRIAQHRLVIENDFQGAENTLKAADDKITEIADPGLLPVRVAISDERVLLKTRSRPDLAGIVLTLSRIIKQLPQLDLSINQENKVPSQTESSLTATTIDSDAPWQDQLLQFAKSLYKVEPLQQSITSPKVNIIDARNTLEEKLKLAKWAVLERDQKQYQQLISQVSELFKRYIDENNHYHSEINTELTRLKELEIRPVLPDISGSLLILKSIILKKEHQSSQSNSAEVMNSKPVETVRSTPENPTPMLDEPKSSSDKMTKEIIIEDVVSNEGVSNE